MFELALIGGWLLGLICGYKYAHMIMAKGFKSYTEEIHKQYSNALDKMRIKYINQDNKVFDS